MSGKFFFFTTLSILLVIFIIWISVLPREFNKCSQGVNNGNCSCPKDSGGISRKNIVLLDTTDYIAPGKFDDIKNIIESYSIKPDSFWKWIASSKKVEMTSIYLLSDEIPSHMLPIGRFCKPPPDIALIASLSNSKIKKIYLDITKEIDASLKLLEKLSAAKNSPIIETISVVTSHATSWTPGGDLVLISDMLQNSNACGLFEKQVSIQKYTDTPSACNFYKDKFKANAIPTQINPLKTNVAICFLSEIKNKVPKPGLLSYWRDFFQDALQYDFIDTCNPDEIKNRNYFLNK